MKKLFLIGICILNISRNKNAIQKIEYIDGDNVAILITKSNECR